ncbi:MAG: ATP-binding protein [Anaerolineales bacterium]
MKLTTKLILAFLFLGLSSVGLVALVTRFSANRELDKFIGEKYQDELSDQLESYYKQNGTWEGVESLYSHEGERPLSFSITDPDGVILVPGFEHRAGDSVSALELAHGKKIEGKGELIIGYVVLNTPPERNPLEEEFIRRINGFIFISAAGAALFALVLGALLSRAVTRPLLELTRATRALAAGNFEQRVPVRSKDEIGELASSFNKMNEDLARSFNLRKQMTADIAHELRAPLSLIIGHAEGVHDGVLQPTRENFEIIREEAERLEKLVNDLRTLSLADAGKLSVEFQRIEMNQFLRDVQKRYAASFANKRVELALTSALEALYANIDPSRFGQALNNILDNALRYTPEGGRVSVALSAGKENMTVSVQDSGEGVGAEEAQRLFDRFYRVDEARNRDDGGSGLGLAITKSIIEMHGGSVWAESEKGRGVKISIHIPFAK